MNKWILWRRRNQTRRGVEERVTRRGMIMLCDQREPGRGTDSSGASLGPSRSQDSSAGCLGRRLWGSEDRECHLIDGLERTKRNPASRQGCLWSAGLPTM
jgi:hypothetical protein